MNDSKMTSRNNTVDILRGIAMLMVVLGHTMTGCTQDSQSSFLFNIVWSLQMPLFIIISGYVCRYSRKIESGKDLLIYIGRRTLAYLLPWCVWTFLIRGLIFGNTYFLNLKWLVYHMDSGYWFLFTIWTISMFFGISEFAAGVISKKCKHQEIVHVILTVTAMVFFEVILAAIGITCGMSFLCVKLTMYYIPYYVMGYLFGKIQDFLFQKKCGKTITDAVVAVSGVVYFAILANIRIFALDDNLTGIIIRMFASAVGCVSIIGLVTCLTEKHEKVFHPLIYIGRYSLQIYLVHNLLLSLLKVDVAPAFASIQGVGLTVMNFAITVLLSLFVTVLTNQNRVLKLMLYGKTR